MNCYFHPERAAIGACKGCSRGLCAECAVDTGKALACRGAHEAYVVDVEALIERNVAAFVGSSKKKKFMEYVGVGVILLLGIAMIVSSVLSDRDSVLEFVGGFILTLSVVIAVAKAWRTTRQKRKMSQTKT